MADARGLAVQVVAAKVLGDRVKEYSDGLKRDLAVVMDAGDRKTAALDDGTKVGAVSFANGRATARVTDEQALLAWVAENHPDELVQQIRPSFLSLLLEDAKKVGHAVSRESGEVIPGIDVSEGAPYLSVRVDDDGLPALTDAVRAGQLLALESTADRSCGRSGQ